MYPGNWIGMIAWLGMGAVWAQVGGWQRINPGGGGVFATVGAGSGGVIVAASDLSGAYRSRDGGRSWDVIGAARGLTETHISGIGFHPTRPELLFIGTENGLFRSADSGGSVMKVLDSGYVTAIEFARGQPHIGYAAYHSTYNVADAIIYKSTDTGRTWYPVSVNLPTGLHVLKIAVDPTNPDVLYVLTGQGRFACGSADVYKSVDGGIHWASITPGFAQEVMDFAIAPTRPSTLFLTTMNAHCDSPYYWTDLQGGLYVSVDGGASWQFRSSYTGLIGLFPDDSNRVVLIDPREPYPWNPRAGTFWSMDGGVSFYKAGDVRQWDVFFNGDPYWCYGASFNGIALTIRQDPVSPGTFYWATSQWVFVSTDTGKTFQNVFTDPGRPGFWRSRGLDNVNMMDVAVSAADPRIVYAAYFDIGLWRSLDGGDSWQRATDSAFTGAWEGHGGNCASVVADPARPHVVWATMSENQNGGYPTYLIKSIDTGAPGSWFSADSGLPRTEIMGLSVDPASPISQRTLYVTADADVYKSVDDGLSWTKVFDCNGCRFTAVDPYRPGLVYAAGENGVWRSSDGGLTWVDVSLPDMKSPPGKRFWDWGYEGVFDVATDPTRPGVAYVVVYGKGKGLYRSADSGDSWVRLLADDFLRKVAVVPSDSMVVYATSSNAFEAGGYDPRSHGVWLSTDGGRTWQTHNEGMAYPFALAIDIGGGDSPMVYVGSPGTGFQRRRVARSSISSRAEPRHPERCEAGCLGRPSMETVGRPVKVYGIRGEDLSSRVGIRWEAGRQRITFSGMPKGVYVVMGGSRFCRKVVYVHGAR